MFFSPAAISTISPTVTTFSSFSVATTPFRGDDQDLLAIMGVEFVPDAFPEMDDADHILLAVGQKHLPRDLRTRKQRIGIGFP